MPIHGRILPPGSTSCWAIHIAGRSQCRTRGLAQTYGCGIHPYPLRAPFAKGPTVTEVDASVCPRELLHERDLRLDRAIDRADDSHVNGWAADKTEWRAHCNGRLPDLDLSTLCRSGTGRSSYQRRWRRCPSLCRCRVPVRESFARPGASLVSLGSAVSHLFRHFGHLGDFLSRKSAESWTTWHF